MIAGGPGGAAQARTGRNGAIPQDRTVRVFDSIVQHLVPFRPVKAHIMLLGESGPAGVGWVRYFYLTQTPSSSRRHMHDPALFWTTRTPLAHGWRHFEEMLMPGEIDLRAMRRLCEQRLQPTTAGVPG